MDFSNPAHPLNPINPISPLNPNGIYYQDDTSTGTAEPSTPGDGSVISDDAIAFGGCALALLLCALLLMWCGRKKRS